MPKITLKSDVAWDGVPAMRVRTGLHEFYIDEPESGGGTNKGPNPVQYLLSSLGGCFIAMGRMVAKEMGIKLEHLRCQVEGDLNPDGLSARDPSVRPGLLAIRMKLDVKSEASPEQLADWLRQVEDRCPVKNCLTVPVPMEIKTN